MPRKWKTKPKKARIPKDATLINEPKSVQVGEFYELMRSKLPEEYKLLSDRQQKVIETVLANVEQGCGLRESCKAAEISESGFFRYRKRYPWIQDALDIVQEARMMVVEDRLYRSAIGYDYETTDVHLEGAKNASGENVGNVRRKEVRKKVHVPPNLSAMIFILKNRSRGKWRADHHLKVQVEDKTDRPPLSDAEMTERLKDLTPEQLRDIRQMGALLLDKVDELDTGSGAVEVDGQPVD